MKNMFSSPILRAKKIIQVKPKRLEDAVRQIISDANEKDDSLVFITNFKSSLLQETLESLAYSSQMKIEVICVSDGKSDPPNLPAYFHFCKKLNPNSLVSSEILKSDSGAFIYEQDGDYLMSFKNPSLADKIDATVEKIKELEE